MASIISRLRKKYSALTPPFVTDDEEILRPLRTTVPRAEAPASTETIQPRLETTLPELVNAPIRRSTMPLESMPAENISPLSTARQNLYQAQNEPLTFGSDKQGNVRYAPKSDLGHRVIAGLKIVGDYLPQALATGGPLGALVSAPIAFTRGAVDPSLPAQIRNRKQIATAQAGYEQELENAKSQAQTENLIQTPTRIKQAQEEQERDNLRQTYQGILSSGQEFKQENAEHKRLHDRAAQLGMTLPYGQKQSKQGIETPHESTRIVAENEYPSISGGTSIRTLWDGEKYTDQLRDGKPLVAAEKPTTAPGEETVKEGQSREAERAAQLSLAETRKGYGDNIDSQLRAKGGLYDQRSEVQSLLARDVLGANPTQDQIAAHNNQLDKLKELNASIANMEGDRNKAYSESGTARANALKFTRQSAAKPESDGKHHYTTAQIRQQARANRVSFQSLYDKLKADKRVVIE